jgi:UDP-N-acetylglucosamine enolpyruvyl transferase
LFPAGRAVPLFAPKFNTKSEWQISSSTAANPSAGTITPSGNKNSVLPIFCATLLTDEPVTLKNVPDITDLDKLVAFFREQGSAVEWDRARRRDAGRSLQASAAISTTMSCRRTCARPCCSTPRCCTG